MSQSDGWANEPETSIDTVADLLEKTSADHGHGPVEAFHRSSRTRRVEWRRSATKVSTRTGCEQGGALRWFDPRHETVGFAASSGDARNSLTVCRSMAARVLEKPVAGCPWNLQAGPVADLDPGAGLPSREDIERWMVENTPDSADWAWVEAGWSTEIRLTDSKAVQRRVRTRLWGMFATETGHKPMFLASRGWRGWAALDPTSTWRARDPGPPGERIWPDDAKVVFSPESSAFVAQMLATAIHHPEIRPGTPVGPGWVLARRSDDDPDSLFGSVVDDAGFPAKTRILADGRHVISDWGGHGSLRRASFRDPPEPTPACLRLDPPKLDPPKRSAWVTRIDLHPASDGWMARLHGREFPDGAAFQPRWTRIRPERWVERCLGGIGPAHRSHQGMTNPALVFDAWLFTED